jgi:hypothetical protein
VTRDVNVSQAKSRPTISSANVTHNAALSRTT